MTNNRLSWDDIANFPAIRLYAGDIPQHAGYDGFWGLSLSNNDSLHIQHDINEPFPLPDNTVDCFQVEDVFEHIPYNRLVFIIDEIYRILKPNAIFRLSLPDYGCDLLQQRSIKDSNGTIIFDPGGGGSITNPGHLWFPCIDNVRSLLKRTIFSSYGEIDFLHFFNNDNTFVAKPIDYSIGHVRRTPDFDQRVKDPYRPMSMVIDLRKKNSGVMQSVQKDKAQMNVPCEIQTVCDKCYFGTEYGGWTICTDFIDQNSIIYSFGAGEDISFDLSLIETFGVVVHAFDPTPKSIEWIKRQELHPNFIFHDYGIADYDGKAFFYPPENPLHVSHTVRYKSQKKAEALLLNVRQLSTIMKNLDHRNIQLLKLDIEGAEYSVLQNILESRIRIKQLCVEFHHFQENIGSNETAAAIELLNAHGYKIFDISSRGYEMAFINYDN